MYKKNHNTIQNFNKKIVLIAGGCGKLGYSFVKSIVLNNGKVVLLDTNENKGKKIQIEFGKDRVLFFKCDITEAKQIDSCLFKATRLFGKVESAVNTTYPAFAKNRVKFENLNMKFLRNELGNHLGGAIIFSQRLIKYFLKQGHGNLIHISSIQGVRPPKFDHYTGTKMTAPIEYCTSKSGIILMVQYLSKYYKGKNIRINSISPGGIFNNQSKKFIIKYKKSCLNKGLLDPEDINGTLLFLLSDLSQYINGQNLIVDDGWVL